MNSKNNHPLVSVIIPSYETQLNKLLRTIRSALAQSYQNKEIIVIDDGSSVPFSGADKFLELQDKAIRWVALRQNQGVASARNYGASCSTADFLAFLDAGDWWEPKKIENQINCIKELQNIGFIFSGAIFHYRTKTKSYPALYYKSFFKELLVWQPITGSASSVMIPKTVFDQVGGFYEEEDIPEDRDLWLRIAKKYPIYVDQNLSVHIDASTDGRSSDPQKKGKTYRRFLERHKNEMVKFDLWEEALITYHFGLMRKYIFMWSLSNAYVQFIKGLKTNPKLFFKKFFSSFSKLIIKSGR